MSKARLVITGVVVEAACTIGIGRTHARTHVLLLVQDLHIRIVNAATGELLRELTLDYQPTGAPKGPTRDPHKRTTPNPSSGFRVIPMS